MLTCESLIVRFTTNSATRVENFHLGKYGKLQEISDERDEVEAEALVQFCVDSMVQERD
jgi:hypothetical protein